MAKPVILCVDDESIMLLALRRSLRMALGDSYRYETALSAEAGLELLGRLEADGVEVAAVISDWLMPGMRGDEFLHRVSAEGHVGCLVLLTGYAESAAMAALRSEVGLAGVFQKPCRVAGIAEVIEASRTLRA